MSLIEIKNLAVSKAKELSKWSGVSWALIDSDQEVIEIDATIIGVNKHKLDQAIDRNSIALEQLFITVEPVPEIFNIESLTKNLANSNCKKIIIGQPLHRNKSLNDRWTEWVHNWNGELEISELQRNTEKLSYGIEKIINNNRPWVSCVITTNLMGKTLPLSNLYNEFGFSSDVLKLTMSSRAIFYSQDQEAITNFFPEVNNVDEAIEIYEIYKNDDIPALLKHCASEGRSNVVIFCNLPLVSQMAKNNLVDEVIYYICHSNKTINLTDEKEQLMEEKKKDIDLSGWTLMSSSVIGNCNRLVYNKKIPQSPIIPKWAQQS